VYRLESAQVLITVDQFQIVSQLPGILTTKTTSAQPCQNGFKPNLIKGSSKPMIICTLTKGKTNIYNHDHENKTMY
jgi:hypothetical protein